MGVKKGCRDNFVMPTLSMLVIRGSCVAATTTMILVRARFTSAAASVVPAMVGPPARFWSLVLSDAKHHGLLFKKDK